MIVRNPLQSPTTFWVTQAALLAPLGVFWISVVTGSEVLSRLLFGPHHTPFRDLLPVVILPGIALLLSLVRLRSGIQEERDAMPKSDRNATMLVAGLVACSIAVVCAYSVTENIVEAGRVAEQSAPR